MRNSPTAKGEVNLDNNRVCELGSGSFQLSLEMRLQACESQRLQLSCTFTNRNYETINVCCFRLLSLGVICYTATDN